MWRPWISLFLLSLSIAQVLPAGSARAASAEEDYLEAREGLLRLVEDERRRKYRDHWMRAIERLDKSASRLPAGDTRCAAWFNGGRAFAEMSKVSYLGDDRAEAERRYRSVADRCPTSFLADDALYRVGEIFLERDPARAQLALEELVRRFPKGDMVHLARERLAELRDGAGPAPKAKTEVAAQPAPKAKTEVAAQPAPKAKTEVAAQAAPKAKAEVAAQAAPKVKTEVAAQPAPKAKAQKESDATIPGSHLPSAADILAALDAEGGSAEEDDRARVEELGKAVGGEVSLSLVAGLKVKRVVIDPGHGGKDTGAIGPGGIKEKDLTLAMAKKLKKHLEEMGLEVLLTRDKDVTLALEDRTRFANEKGADLFLSLHVNAAHNKKAFGIETYTLNLNSDRYAMRLAARENASSNRRIGDLQFILADLATKANTDDSVQLAKLVQGKMVTRLRAKHGTDKIRDLGVKQALFFVLVGAKMPAVLLETGFISNAEEAKRLRSSDYQEEVTRGVAQGVRQFILDREAIATGRLEPGSTGVF